MTSYRYIGYGVTDSNGVAHLDHDKNGNPINGYTGTGAGEVDVIASTDNPITSGSIVSETYSLIDAKFKDIGTNGQSNYTAFYLYSNFNPRVTDTGTVFTNSTSSSLQVYPQLDSATDLYDWIPSFCIEFDAVEVSGTLSNQAITITENGGSVKYKNFNTIGLNGACHMKITCTPTQIIIQKNNETPITEDYSMSKVRIGILLNNGSLKYKNFVIYPI